MEKPLRTLRGFIKGSEREEETYFSYSATLRISGEIPEMEEISSTLGLKSTHSHREAERRSKGATPYRQDMWAYTPAVRKSEPLDKHIDVLWSLFKPHKRYLLRLKQTAMVDVFLGYRTNCDTAGIEVPHTSLEMFTELQIPFGARSPSHDWR